MWLKVAIVILLIGALISLGSALVFLIRDQGKRERTKNALFVRVVLCALILVLIVYGFASGKLTPHSPYGLQPPGSETAR